MNITANQTTTKPCNGRWIILISASLLFFYNFLQLNILNTIDSQIIHAFSINATQFGVLSSMYFYTSFLLILPAGLLLDKFSTKKLILTAMLVAVISMSGFALAPNFYVAAGFRLMSGITGAFAFLSCIRLASRWFEPKQMALASGVIITLGMLGGMVAQTPMALLSQTLGWRQAMMIASGIGVALTIIILLTIKDWPTSRCDAISTNKVNKPDQKTNVWHRLQIVISNPCNWLGGIYTALMNLPVFLLGALWGNMYLVKVHNLTTTQASYITAIMLLGLMIGSPLIGWLSDQIQSRRLPMIMGSMASLLVILVIIFAPNLSLLQLLLLFLLLGLVSSSQVLSFPLITELNPPHATGAANSVVALVIMSSGFIFQPMFGWLMDLHKKMVTLHHLPLYTAHDLNFAISIIPIAFLLAISIAIVIKKT